VGLADNRDIVANSPYLTKVGDFMPRFVPSTTELGSTATCFSPEEAA